MDTLTLDTPFPPPPIHGHFFSCLCVASFDYGLRPTLVLIVARLLSFVVDTPPIDISVACPPMAGNSGSLYPYNASNGDTFLGMCGK